MRISDSFEHSESLRPPFQCRGGLIADEVGLGKTLTILSAIASSMKKSAKFLFPDRSEEVMTELTRRTRATLVVVPSFRLPTPSLSLAND